MTGSWSAGPGLSGPGNISANTGTSSGVVLTGASAAYTKGSYSQLIASTSTDIAWIMVECETLTSGGQYFAVDIAVGASGVEVVILGNLVFSAPGSWSNVYYLPFNCPAGTRVAARMSSSNGGFDTMPINVLFFQDRYASVGVGSAVDTYGFSPTTNIGTAIDPGTSANTKGAYSTITSSTAGDLAGIIVNYDAQTATTSTGTVPHWLIDIAIGGSGSEVVVIPNKWLVAYAGGTSSLFMAYPHYLALPIPAGTRIAARAQCSVTATPDRIFGITIYGIRM